MRDRGGADDGGNDAEGYTGPSTPVYSVQGWTRASGAGEADGARRDRSLSITHAKTHGKVENGLYEDISPFSEAIQQCSECCRGALSEARA